MLAHLLTETGITVWIKDGQKRPPYVMGNSHKLYAKLVAAVKAKDVQEVLNVVELANNAKVYMNNQIRIEDGEVYYGDEVLDNVIVGHILTFMENDLPFEHLLKFLENLMQNPSKQAVDELYLFLQANSMPITEDGRFIAYKWVKTDGYDCHTGHTNHHDIGTVATMPRRQVDDRREQTCSTGLHVCSPGYTKFGDRLFLVAVNPKDVVSVPYNYNNSKMRVCEYECIEEIAEAEYREFDSVLYKQQN